MQKILACAGLAAVTLLVATAPLQAQPIGVEFRANTTVAGSQARSSAAMASDGRFILVWRSDGQDGDSFGIFGQRYNADGTVSGGEFPINVFTTGSQTLPQVSMRPTGEFVVTWQSVGIDADSYGVAARRFNALGIAQGGEILANTQVANRQGRSQVSVDDSGDFTVVWPSLLQDGSSYSVHGQRYEADGTPKGTEFQVNSFSAGSQDRARLDSAPGGQFVVIWDSHSQDADGLGIFARVYGADGAPAGPEFQVNEFTQGNQFAPGVAMAADGSFVATWWGLGASADGGDAVTARLFDPSGAPRGPEFRVNTTTAGNQSDPAITMDRNGNFVIAWRSDPQDGSGSGIFAQKFRADGARQGIEFQANTTTAGDQADTPAMAMTDSANFVIGWRSVGQDGSSDGVFAQRFAFGPSVTVMSPRSGQAWEPGTRVPISFVHTLGAGGHVRIELSRNNGLSFDEVLIANFGADTLPAGDDSFTATTGVFNWDVGGNNTSTAVVRITSTTDATVTDVSEAFAIANVAIFIGNATVTEGASGTTNAVFPVTLSRAHSQTVTVAFATAAGTATAGTDFVASSGTVSFAAGSTSATVTVAVNGDTASETEETFFVNLTTPVNASIADAQGLGRILNDDITGPDVVLQSFHPLEPVMLGTGIDYRFRVTNQGPLTAPGVTLTNAVPASVTLTNVTTTRGTCSGGVCNLGDMLDGESAEITMTGTPSANGPIYAQVSVGPVETGSQYANNFALEHTAVWPGGRAIRPKVASFNVRANDDGFSDEVAMGFPINFFGLTFTTGWVNNNGNITFDHGLSTFTPFSLSSTNAQIMAPFFADVDTRGAASGLVSYGTTRIEGKQAFVGNWVRVGYFASHTDKLNDFQMIVFDRSDINAGDVDVEFNVDQIQWETGDASGGSGGVGGSSARSGYANGTGDPGTFFELPGSAVNGAFLDNGPNALREGSIDSSVPGRYRFRVRNGSIAQADLALSGSATPNPASEGGNLTYNLVLTNNGPTPSEGISFTYTLPSTVTYVSATAAGGTCTQASGTVTCAMGTLAVAATRAITIVVNVNPGTTSVSSTFDVAGNEPDPNSGNNTLTVVTPVSRVITIADSSLAEGNAGTTNMVFTLRMVPAHTGAVTVNFATANGTATAGTDYTATNGTVTFAAGQTSRTVSVPVIGDTTPEPDETFFVNLSGATGAAIGDGQAVGTILEDEPLLISISDSAVTEADTTTVNSRFTITLSRPASVNVTVQFATANNTATAGSDYVGKTGSLTFLPGTTSKTLNVTVNGDLTQETNESYFVNLSAPVGATIGDGQGVGTIVEDTDPAPGGSPNMVISNASPNEGNAGTTPATFTVTLSAASAGSVRVSWATGTTGTATSGNDYTPSSGSLTFNPGVTARTLVVPVIGDTTAENNETFHVNLSQAVGANVTDPTGVGTIRDDEPRPTISIGNANALEGDAGSTNMPFQVTLSAPSTLTVTVRYATGTAGSATAGTDYTAVNGTLTFNPGVTSQNVQVPILGDTTVEPNEAFYVNLSAPTNATIADNQGAGTITNEDP